MQALVGLYVVIVGLLFGSFINAFVWRFREVHDDDGNVVKKLSAKKRRELSIVKGRSMCPHCQHQLSALDLVPVMSWLYLRGRCRYCHVSISRQYPIVELLTSALAGASYVFWPYGFNAAGMVAFASWLVVVFGFVALSIYDVKWYLLPDKLVFPLLVPAIVCIVALGLITDEYTVYGALQGVSMLAGLFYILYKASAGSWIGGGDVKLALVLGLLSGGGIDAVLVLFLASTFGLLVALPLVLQGRAAMKSRIPFGPMLMAGSYVAFLFGERMISWYLHALYF